MQDSGENGSIEREPHFSGEAFESDPREEAATRKLQGEARRRDGQEELAEHSVFDEPAILPNRPPVEIDRDWACGQCGYNLRGLMTGHRCPECGNVELYHPPREGELIHADWLATQTTTPLRAWGATVGLAVSGAVLAAWCSLMAVEFGGPLPFVVIGPAIAEIGKVAAAAVLVDRRSRLLIHSAQLYALALGTAVVFSITQNIILLNTVYAGAAMEVVAFRYIAGTGLHVICTYVAARGLVKAWQMGLRGGPRTTVTLPFGHLGVAIGLHAGYNAIVFAWGAFGYGF